MLRMDIRSGDDPRSGTKAGIAPASCKQPGVSSSGYLSWEICPACGIPRLLPRLSKDYNRW